MYEAGKATAIALEMKRYNIALLGLSEVRWIKSGMVKLTSGELILYSGHNHENAIHTEGVGFMLSNEAQKSLISWEPINSRLITATFKTKHQ